jgi:hypothetical protein
MRYALRRRDQKWTVCLGDCQLLAFEDFEEAFLVAWNAALIIERSKGLPSREWIGRSAWTRRR